MSYYCTACSCRLERPTDWYYVVSMWVCQRFWDGLKFWDGGMDWERRMGMNTIETRLGTENVFWVGGRVWGTQWYRGKPWGDGSVNKLKLENASWSEYKLVRLPSDFSLKTPKSRHLFQFHDHHTIFRRLDNRRLTYMTPRSLSCWCGSV